MSPSDPSLIERNSMILGHLVFSTVGIRNAELLTDISLAE